VAAVTGYTANLVRAIAPHDNQYSPIGDQGHRHPGPPGLLSGAQYTALVAVLDQPSSKGTVKRGRRSPPGWLVPSGSPYIRSRIGKSSDDSACAQKCQATACHGGPGRASGRSKEFPSLGQSVQDTHRFGLGCHAWDGDHSAR